MAGPLGSTLLQILGVVSPSKIHDIAGSATTAKRVPLVKLVLEEDDFNQTKSKLQDEAKGKLLKFKQKKSDDDSSEEENGEEKQKFDKYGRKEKTKAKIKKDDPKIEEKIGMDDDLTTTVFIMKEKQKLDKSQKKLKYQEIIQLYKDTTSVEISKSSNSKDNDTDKDKKSNATMSSSGILVNKKSS